MTTVEDIKRVRGEQVGCFVGLVNVCKLYFCCYLIVKGVQLAVRVIR